MSSVASGQGTLVAPITGAGVRVPISTVGNTTPIAITTSSPHGFLTGDTIEQEGTTVAAANGQFQIVRTGASTYTLTGTTASGAGTSGYAIDYELTPATTIPSNGDLIDATVLGAAVESTINPQPFLYRRTGKWRLYNQYTIDAGAILPPFYSSPWSTNSPFSSSTAVALASSTLTLQSLSDDLGLAPNFASGDLLVMSTSFTALVSNSANTQHSICQVGVGLVYGGSLVSTGGFPSVLVDAQSTVATAVPCCVSGDVFMPTSGITVPTTALSLCLFGRVDLAPSSGTFTINLIGPWIGTVLQYRAN